MIFVIETLVVLHRFNSIVIRDFDIKQLSIKVKNTEKEIK